MASIDRYRPPREGYQPPVVAGGARNDAIPPKSPTRRRDVPPAVPTPPQHEARSSPPRSQSHLGQPSPVRSGGQTPLRGTNQWYFTAAETESTPTIVEGVQPSEERMRRAKGVNFIYQAGVMLDLPQITLWVAGVFFHRFFMRYSMEQDRGGIHHYVSDLTCQIYGMLGSLQWLGSSVGGAVALNHLWSLTSTQTYHTSSD